MSRVSAEVLIMKMRCSCWLLPDSGTPADNHHTKRRQQELLRQTDRQTAACQPNKKSTVSSSLLTDLVRVPHIHNRGCLPNVGTFVTDVTEVYSYSYSNHNVFLNLTYYLCCLNIAKLQAYDEGPVHMLQVHCNSVGRRCKSTHLVFSVIGCVGKYFYQSNESEQKQ